MAKSDLESAIETLEAAIGDPSTGLPDEVFYFMTRITPSVNVDLLIMDDQNRTLLAWRKDEFAGSGWHIPGGILRYKESLMDRASEVARLEIGQGLTIKPEPIAMNQMWKKRATRGHFVSVLYECRVTDAADPPNEGRGPDDAGYLQWHESCPDDLIEVHEKIYREFICSESIPEFSGEIPVDYFPNL